MRVRPATADDAQAVAALLLELPGGIRNLIPEVDTAARVSRAVFATSRSVLSHRFSLAAEDRGAVVGVLVRLPGRTWRRLRMPTGLSIVRAAGVLELPGIITRGRIQDRLIPPVDPEALYIPALAVAPRRRGQGIGSMLLVRAMGEAAELGLGSVVLDVASENVGAIRFYQRTGFHRVSEQRVEPAAGGPGQGSVRMEASSAPRR